MLSVDEALARVTAGIEPLPAEQIALVDALGRVLARDAAARRTQPPLAVSAMDGYAVHSADVATTPVTLKQVGAVAAGEVFTGTVEPGETVRIFTGAPLPDGTDAIVIQEDTEADGDAITMREPAPVGHYVRPAGLDFREGDIGLEAGRRLTATDVALAAAMNLPWLAVHRRPKVAILATGNEVEMPGDPIAPHQIVSSNSLGLAAFVTDHGGEPLNLGIARDTVESLQETAEGARGADILVTIGGASVGEHDLVQSALGPRGLEVDFWRIAMRPGKPLMFGRFGDAVMLGLPGNPVSSMVCALLFLRPLMHRMLGLRAGAKTMVTATLATDLPANDQRQDYLRARLSRTADGELTVTPFPKQDSSMLSFLAQSDCLVVRPPLAPPMTAGARVEIIPLAASADR